MQFTPKTEKEIDEENLIPAGIYPFEVVKAEDKVSKGGNDMIAINLKVFFGERSSYLNDYLLESFAHKLRHACVQMGMESKYEKGEIAASDFVGKTGWAKISIRKDKLKKGEPERDLYPDQNQVVDYVEEPKQGASAPVASAASAGAGGFADDDIPFAPNVV